MPIKTDRRDADGIARLLHLGWFRPVHCKSVSAQEVRAVLGARKAIQQGMITLELSVRGLLRNFGLKVGAISRGRYEHRIRELVDGNSMLQAATCPMLRARATLRQELAGLERYVRQMAQDDPVMLEWMWSFGDLQRVGVEATGPDKHGRRARGKSDTFDAEAAAHAAFARKRTVTPKTRDGMVEALRVLKA